MFGEFAGILGTEDSKMSFHISKLQANLNKARQNQDQIRNEKIQLFRDRILDYSLIKTFVFQKESHWFSVLPVPTHQPNYSAVVLPETEPLMPADYFDCCQMSKHQRSQHN